MNKKNNFWKDVGRINDVTQARKVQLQLFIWINSEAPGKEPHTLSQTDKSRRCSDGGNS